MTAWTTRHGAWCVPEDVHGRTWGGGALRCARCRRRELGRGPACAWGRMVQHLVGAPTRSWPEMRTAARRLCTRMGQHKHGAACSLTQLIMPLPSCTSIPVV